MLQALDLGKFYEQLLKSLMLIEVTSSKKNANDRGASGYY